MNIEKWFLSNQERGNPWTRLAYRHGDQGWSSGNGARVHVHGADYFARLRELIEAQGEGDILLFTDWRGDPDEQMSDDGTTIVEVFTAAAARGVMVKGLFWRSHLDKLAYSETENRSLANAIRDAGGEVILDMRVLPFGSHHQKLVVLRHRDDPTRDAAFIGGIDLCHTRRDDALHRGDPQPVQMGEVWGQTPAWHDMMIEVHGPAVGDVEATFRERWDDPTPPVLDPISLAQARLKHDDEHADPMPPQQADPPRAGTANVQILRTYPARRPSFPFAPEGERSIARAYNKAVRRAESLIYIEDQYFWSGEVVSCFATALAQNPELRMIVVLSTYTMADTRAAKAGTMWSRVEALRDLYRAGGDRVGVYGLENHWGTPVYVHSKFCVVDDVWMTVGSDNVNRRSWTYDSEITCAVLDETRDEREPCTLRADGDQARSLPRETRLRLFREHLDRNDDAGLIDPATAFKAFRESAARLDAWHAAGRLGTRPPGRVRTYPLPEITPLEKAFGKVAYRFVEDPDGRPRRLRGTNRF
ncbi:phospholipase D family protein [Gephyromycinifex aptenodytis]|uniref:phospholipase D family protein n=1 Tax=Gephyromycinifex aptenodytis TaxID=2716227 RepID=UPI001447FCBE|nr:phospholipase D family protein [Gephyromycinifex aptenodytis]